MNLDIGANATIENLVVEPEYFEMLLANNTDNRYLRTGFSEFLAREITRGNWVLTCDAIGVDINGVLLNGQHRAYAAVLAGMPIRVFLALNMPLESREHSDRGTTRTQADNLKLTPDMVSDAKMIAFRLSKTVNGRISNSDITDILSWWLPVHDTLMRVANRPRVKGVKAPKGNNASIRIGFGLRFAVGSRAEQAYALDQFSAFITGDAKQMSKATFSIWEKAWGRDRKNMRDFDGTRTGRSKLLSYCFHASDYSRRDGVPVVQDYTLVASEMAQWLRMMKAAKEAGPTRNNHPYVFPSAPVVERKLTGIAAIRHAAKQSSEEVST